MDIKRNIDRIVRKIVAGSGSVPSFKRFVDEYETDDYPYGRHRTTASWKVESKGDQQRVCRVTVNPKSGRTNKPKCTTLAPSATIGIASDDKIYPVTGRPGQIMVWSGDMKHTEASVFPDDSGYNDLADALGFRQIPNKVTVKETRDGVQIDGLQGKKMTIREVLNLAGIPNDVLKNDVEDVKRKPSRDHTKDVWTVTFRPEVDRPPYIIEIYT